MCGTRGLKQAEAGIFKTKEEIANKVTQFAQDVSEYAAAVITPRKVLSKMKIVPAAQIHEALTEDFGMGVGAPVGADQGIPYGGDGKAVVPCYMGMTSRFGAVGNKATGFGHILWPKRKKRRLKRRYPNFVQESLEDDELTPVNIAKFLEDEGLDDHVYKIDETEDNRIVVMLNADPMTSNAVQDVNNLFDQFYTDYTDYNSSEVIIILIDRLTQTAAIRIGEDETLSGIPCTTMTDFETVWETLNNLTER